VLLEFIVVANSRRRTESRKRPVLSEATVSRRDISGTSLLSADQTVPQKSDKKPNYINPTEKASSRVSTHYPANFNDSLFGPAQETNSIGKSGNDQGCGRFMQRGVDF
jgi:hypothetical protein